MNMNAGGGKLWRLKEEDEYERRRWKEGWSEWSIKRSCTCVKQRIDMQNYVEWPKIHTNEHVEENKLGY